VLVTVDNFPRAESDLYFRRNPQGQRCHRKFLHRREPARIDNQTVIRLNRDTLYSSALFDLDAGPVTITLLTRQSFHVDAGPSMRITMCLKSSMQRQLYLDQGQGRHALRRRAIRTLVDPASEKDIEQVRTLQDAIKVSQKSIGSFEAPTWDQPSQKKVRDAFLVLATTIPDFRKAFGTKAEVDPTRHLIGTAAGWGRQSRQGRGLSQHHAAKE